MRVSFVNRQSPNFFELLFISIFWILLLISPLLFQWINKSTVNWSAILNVWIDYVPLFVIFSINRGVLIPKFLFKSRASLYLISVAILIGITVMGSITIRKELTSQREVPKHERALLKFPESRKTQRQRQGLDRSEEPQKATTPPYINLILLSILLVGFDTGMKLSVRWAKTLQQKAEIERENVKNELAFLRNQINPHFLMNTLNNIHSLIDFDREEAKKSIAKLSVLMRHLLYESDERPIILAKEINFIESYVELMRLRFSEDVEISLKLPTTIPDISIPPLLFTNIIENAFKYGISCEEESFVRISLYIHESELEFRVLNSLHKKQDTVESSGIGIENTKKRLNLIYKDNYLFSYTEENNIFSSTIKIPI